MLFIRKFAPFAAAALALQSSPAAADAITFDASDIGTAHTLTYNGNIGGSDVSGLSGSATFTLTGIAGSTYTFAYSVTNTSSAPITGSRISSFAFDSNPDIASASSTGAFSYTTLSSSYPNGVGSVDVCFKDASTGSCAGGGGGGLNLGQTGTGTFSLTYAAPTGSVTLSDFFVRYQSIDGMGYSGASGTGAGVTTTTTTTSTSSGNQVPEPGMLGLLGGALIATAFIRRRRRMPATLRPALI